MIEIVEKKRRNRVFWARMFYAQLMILFCVGLTMLIARAICYSKYHCGKQSTEVVNISVTRLNSTALMSPSGRKGLRVVSIMLSMGKPWPQDQETVAKGGFIRIASGKLADKVQVGVEGMKNFASSLSFELGQKPPIEPFPRPVLSSVPKNPFETWERIGPFLNLPPVSVVGLDPKESKWVVGSSGLRKEGGKETGLAKKRSFVEARSKKRGGSGVNKRRPDSRSTTYHGRIADQKPEKTAKPKTVATQGKRRYVNRCLATTTKRRHTGDVSTAAGELKVNSRVKLPATGAIHNQSTTDRNARNEKEVSGKGRVNNGSNGLKIANELTGNTKANDLNISRTAAAKTSRQSALQSITKSENETGYLSSFPTSGKENDTLEDKVFRDSPGSIVNSDKDPLKKTGLPSTVPQERRAADLFVRKGHGGEANKPLNETEPLIGPTSLPPIEKEESENDAKGNAKVPLVTRFNIFKDILDKALAKFDEDANEIIQPKSNGNLELDSEVDESSLDDDIEVADRDLKEDLKSSLFREVGQIATQLDALGMLWNAMKPSLKLLSRSDAGKVLDAIVDTIQLDDDKTDFESENQTFARESKPLATSGGGPNITQGVVGNLSKPLPSASTKGSGATDHHGERPRHKRSTEDGKDLEVEEGQKTNKREDELDDDIVKDDDFSKVMELDERRKRRVGGSDDYIFGDNPGFVLAHQKRDVASDQMEEDAISRELANLLIEKVYNRLLKKVETPGGEREASSAEQKKKERAKRSIDRPNRRLVKREEAFTPEEREHVRRRLCQKAYFMNTKVTDDDGIETDFYRAMIVGELCNFTDPFGGKKANKSSNATAILSRIRRESSGGAESGEEAAEAEDKDQQKETQEEEEEEESTGKEANSEAAEESSEDVSEVQSEKENELNAAAAAAAAAEAVEEDVAQLKARSSDNNKEANAEKSSDDEMKNAAADKMEYEGAGDAEEKRVSADEAQWKETEIADDKSDMEAEEKEEDQEEEEKEEIKEEEAEAKQRRAKYGHKKRSSEDEIQESQGDFDSEEEEEADSDLWQRKRREGDDSHQAMAGSKGAVERELRDVDDSLDTGKGEAGGKEDWNSEQESNEEATNKKKIEAAGHRRARHQIGKRESVNKRFYVEEYADEVLNDALPPGWEKKRRDRSPRQAEFGGGDDKGILGRERGNAIQERSSDENADKEEEEKRQKEMREGEKTEMLKMEGDQSLLQTDVDRRSKAAVVR